MQELMARESAGTWRHAVMSAGSEVSSPAVRASIRGAAANTWAARLREAQTMLRPHRLSPTPESRRGKVSRHLPSGLAL